MASLATSGRPIPSVRPRLTLGLLSVQHGLIHAQSALLPLVFVEVVAIFGVGVAAVGILLGIANLLNGAVQLAFGPLSRYVARPRILGGAGLLFGVVPAWASSRRALADTLREGVSTAGRARTRLRDALVVGQLGLSLGLVSAAALLGRSLLNARSADPGFDPDGLVVAWVDPAAAGRDEDAAGRDVYRRLLERLDAEPGTSAVTIANQAPVVGGHSRSTVRPAGRDDVEYEAERIVVGPAYFATLGIPILRGRALRGLDDEPEPVVVVNQALADMFWPGEDPVGKALEGSGTWRVVGLAGDVQMRSLRSPARPAVYYPLAHLYASPMVLHLRTDGTVRPAAMRSAAAEVDADVPVATILDLRQGLAASMGEARTLGMLVAVFAGLALVLAAVGLYGLVAYGAARRVREMAIRIALGARPDALVGLVLRRGLGLALVGILAGLGVSWLLGQALSGLLFGVAPSDPLALGAASALLLATAALAAWVPARRAARVDPATSLRDAEG